MSGDVARRPAAMTRAGARTSSAVCTKLSATRSTPSARPNRRSSTSFAVSADAGSAHARRVDALVLRRARRRSRPPSSRPRSPSLARPAARSGRRRAAGGRRAATDRDQLGVRASKMRPGRAGASPVAMRSVVAVRRACSGRPPASGPVRIFGPLRSCRMATDAARRSAAARMRRTTCRVRLVRAVREVEPEHVDAGRDQRVELSHPCRRPGRRWR